MSARQTALQVLIACRQEDGWSNGILKRQISQNRLDKREAALATCLCYGVMQNRLKLDFYLKQLLTGKLKNLHPVVRDILHLGLFQLYELDRIPDSAAVNESVELTKRFCRGQRNASQLVNGVLRSAVRMNGLLQQPKSLEDRYSHPWPLIASLRDYVGKERLESMLIANNQAPDTVIQVNTLRTDLPALVQMLQEEGVQATPHPWMENCLVLSGTGALEQLPSFAQGLFYVQDTAAKLSVQCLQLAPEPGQQILDCCAAPGGKTFAAAIATKDQGTIYSCDVYAHKTALIEKGAQRLGLQHVHAAQWDATQFRPEWEQKMDTVIADVPCSGYGIIRKKPDIRYKDMEKMRQLPQLQFQILENQSRYVKPGGLLLYSTCTLVREENEGVVEAFLAGHPEFQTEPLPLPPVFPKNETGMLALVPGEYDTDGFFICRLRRML